MKFEGGTTLLETVEGTNRGRAYTRFKFADGRYVTVWHDGAIRLVSREDAPDWQVSNGYVNQSNAPGSRCWEGGPQA